MTKRFFIKQTSLEEELNAGPKAKRDTYTTLQKRGYQPIVYKSNSKYKLNRYYHGFSLIFRILKLSNSIVLIENPIESWRIITVATRIMRFRNNHLVLLIHDIESERYKHFAPQIEFNYLNTFNSVIAHNNIMKAFLENRLNKDIRIYSLEIFDYLLDADFAQTERPDANVDKNDWQIIFCGNLTRLKTAFLYSVQDIEPINWMLNLYGLGIEELPAKWAINYQGSFSPDKPTINANSNFGLIWDGNSIATCAGLWGSYMKMNNPHKLSLYIALKLPIIVWNHAAVARFVEDNGIGFSIGSMAEVSEKLALLTETDYSQFKQNITLFSQRVTSGFYLDSVLTKIEQDLLIS